MTATESTGDDRLPLDRREVVIRGLKVPDDVGEGIGGEVNGDENGFVPILRAAAGNIEEVDRAEARDVLEDNHQDACLITNGTLERDVVRDEAIDEDTNVGGDDDVVAGHGGARIACSAARGSTCSC